MKMSALVSVTSLSRSGANFTNFPEATGLGFLAVTTKTLSHAPRQRLEQATQGLAAILLGNSYGFCHPKPTSVSTSSPQLPRLQECTQLHDPCPSLIPHCRPGPATQLLSREVGATP